MHDALEERRGTQRDVHVVKGLKAKLKAQRAAVRPIAPWCLLATMSVLNAVRNDNTAFSEIPIMFAHSLHTKIVLMSPPLEI